MTKKCREDSIIPKIADQFYKEQQQQLNIEKISKLIEIRNYMEFIANSNIKYISTENINTFHNKLKSIDLYIVNLIGELEL